MIMGSGSLAFYLILSRTGRACCLQRAISPPQGCECSVSLRLV